MPELTEIEIERLALIGEARAIADLCADRWLSGRRADPHLLRRQRIVTSRLLELIRGREAPADNDRK